MQRRHLLQCRLRGRHPRLQRRGGTRAPAPRRSRGGSTSRTAGANWSGNLSENAEFVQGALNALHETEGIPDVGIYASPGVWNNIVGNYTPAVPYWMADYLQPPSGPGSCADYQNGWPTMGTAPHGPLEIVQYDSQQYDMDYAC